MTAMLAISLCLATLSYRLVEAAGRRRQRERLSVGRPASRDLSAADGRVSLQPRKGEVRSLDNITGGLIDKFLYPCYLYNVLRFHMKPLHHRRHAAVLCSLRRRKSRIPAAEEHPFADKFLQKQQKQRESPCSRKIRVGITAALTARASTGARTFASLPK
jgi:hypothetical protein